MEPILYLSMEFLGGVYQPRFEQHQSNYETNEGRADNKEYGVARNHGNQMEQKPISHNSVCVLLLCVWSFIKFGVLG